MSEKIDLHSTTRFSDRVENYVKYRPHYPQEILNFLSKECGFSAETVIADIGSGTGISAELFIENGNKVFAVEPNKDMRAAAERIFSDNKNFISIAATAEETTLQDKSIDMILAGQAFHWFDKDVCRKEFERILKNGGYVVLMWNLRDRKSKFMEEYEKLLIEYGTNYANLYQDDVDREENAEFFSPVENKITMFTNFQFLDYKALEGRLLSSSYIPLRDKNPERFDEMITALKEIFKKNQRDEKVKMEYQTTMFYGPLS